MNAKTRAGACSGFLKPVGEAEYGLSTKLAIFASEMRCIPKCEE